MTPTTPQPPLSESLCIGRDELCQRLVNGSLKSGITLFFGGPKSGKRTTLDWLVRTWPLWPGGAVSLQRLPVLLDLQRAPKFESDWEFYRFALEAVKAEVKQRLPDFPFPQIALERTNCTSCQWFFEQVSSLVTAASNVDFKIVLIVHRFDYLLVQPFADVLERNMVSFFLNSDPRHGRSIGSQSQIGLILSGGAKLYAQSRNPDSHSSLRGVLEREYCLNLISEDLRKLARLIAGDKANTTWVNAAARAISSATGGQVTLARQMAEPLMANGPIADTGIAAAQRRAVSEMRERANQLLHNSREDLSKCGTYSNTCLDSLRASATLDEPLLRAALQKAGTSETLWRHAMESVAMCGFAHYDRLKGTLVRCNEFFWDSIGWAEAQSDAKLQGSKATKASVDGKLNRAEEVRCQYDLSIDCVIAGVIRCTLVPKLAAGLRKMLEQDGTALRSSLPWKEAGGLYAKGQIDSAGTRAANLQKKAKVEAELDQEKFLRRKADEWREKLNKRLKKQNIDPTSLYRYNSSDGAYELVRGGWDETAPTIYGAAVLTVPAGNIAQIQDAVSSPTGRKKTWNKDDEYGRDK